VENNITSGLNQVLLIYPGSVTKAEDAKLEFEPLMVTGSDNAGTADAASLRRSAKNAQVFARQRTKSSYILAAAVHGTMTDDDLELAGVTAPKGETASESPSKNPGETAGESASADGDPKKKKEIDDIDTTAVKERTIKAVIVNDIDWIIPDFFYIRSSGDAEVLPATQNVTLILNIIDSLAGDERFIGIRKRTRDHRTLTKIDSATQKYRDNALAEQEEFVNEIQKEIDEAQKRFQEKIDAVSKMEGLSETARRQREEAVRLREQDRLKAEMTALETKRSRRLKQIDYDLDQEVRSVQDLYKLFAILIPPIPPLLLALWVFFRRRGAEQEGIAKSRLR
jgi:ABC-2 type transport system permease protein